MAEFCLKCWNELNGTNDPPQKFIISKDLDLCEGCGKLTHVILMERKYAYLRKFRFIAVPFKILYSVLFILCRILILPYLIYKHKKNNNSK
mgnify:CR=1 FL=1